MEKSQCECDFFFVADVELEGNRIRLRPQSTESLVEHVGKDRGMAIGFLLEVARTLGQLGFVASREGVEQAELRIEDPMRVLTGEQPLPWHLAGETAARKGVIRTMSCCEGHGRPYYCTAPN